jgi:hypothetical protein
MNIGQNRRYILRGTPGRAGTHAMSAPSPVDGEVRRTALPDTFDGIRFQIGRMVKYVQDARKDPLVIDTARLAAVHYAKFVEEMSAREGNPISAHNNKTIMLEGIDIWCRHHFCYVNDPPNIEVIQTPRRMVKMTKVAREVLEHIMEPFYAAMEEVDPAFYRGSYSPPPAFIGDCDEPVALMLAMCCCLDITPVRFRFGGNEGTLHHVWGRVFADGNWYDSDLTEPGYKLGDVSTFEAYEEVEVPL